MPATNGKNELLLFLIQLLYIIFFASLVCSFRVISSISIGLILFTSLLYNWKKRKPFFLFGRFAFFVTGCIFYFLLQLLSLFYTGSGTESWDNLALKSGLLFIPLAVCSSYFLDNQMREKILSWFCLLLALALFYSFCIVLVRYSRTQEPSYFFYHALVNPLKQHAVFISILVFIALMHLLESIRRNEFLFNRKLKVFLIIYFTIFLFLLSSKLVIVFFIMYMLVFFFGLFKKSRINRSLTLVLFIIFVIAGSLVLITRNPVSERFGELTKGGLGVIKQENFTPGDYFNSLQFRILQWKLVREILDENKSWWTGVGPVKAQDLLDGKYISRNMYTGDPLRNDKGYLGYNTHNQFLEAVLRHGIPGLVVFLFILLALFHLLLRSGSRNTVFIFILLLCWSFTESVFETQYGIVIFSFFPLFIPWSKK